MSFLDNPESPLSPVCTDRILDESRARDDARKMMKEFEVEKHKLNARIQELEEVLAASRQHYAHQSESIATLRCQLQRSRADTEGINETLTLHVTALTKTLVELEQQRACLTDPNAPTKYVSGLLIRQAQEQLDALTVEAEELRKDRQSLLQAILMNVHCDTRLKLLVEEKAPEILSYL